MSWYDCTSWGRILEDAVAAVQCDWNCRRIVVIEPVLGKPRLHDSLHGRHAVVSCARAPRPSGLATSSGSIGSPTCQPPPCPPLGRTRSLSLSLSLSPPSVSSRSQVEARGKRRPQGESQREKQCTSLLLSLGRLDIRSERNCQQVPTEIL